MTVTLILPQHLSDDLIRAAQQPRETAGVLLVSVVRLEDNRIRLLGRAIEWVDEPSYIKREVDHLAIAAEGYVHALGKAEQIGAIPLWLHTHPGFSASPEPSPHDHIVDDKISDLFRLRSGSPFYGTLIVSPRSNGLAFTGTLQEETRETMQIDRLWTVGDRLSLTSTFNAAASAPLPAFDRNVRAFGNDIQHALHALHIGIVGCGGTGSAVAEQLVRLGVRDITLIDPDDVSESNVTRLYGSYASDHGRPKVDVVADHLRRIAPGLRCESIQAMVTVESTARKLVPCDVVFGCTDDNAGRLVLSRISTYFLTPVIDCGVLLSSNGDGVLTGIDGRVTVLTPGQACLVCRGRIDIARASAELMTPEERRRREDEGYAPALGGVEPAVITFTTAVAAAAINELLERFIGYGADPRPSEILLRFHDREISGNLALPRERHYCHPDTGKLGVGFTQPFLEQAWPS